MTDEFVSILKEAALTWSCYYPGTRICLEVKKTTEKVSDRNQNKVSAEYKPRTLEVVSYMSVW